jgi:hypothetical protein
MRYFQGKNIIKQNNVQFFDSKLVNGCKQDSQNRFDLPIAKYHDSHICILVSDCFVYNLIKLDDWCIKQTQRGLETEITHLGEQTITIQHKIEE